jgi:fermentation-respiration switch protein FrsA (DUF1100 family)
VPEAFAVAWTRRGAAVASIDLPLQGARASAKLGEWLGAGPAERRPALAAVILREFARQAVSDLGRCLDALARPPAIDPARVAFAGLGLGARVGALFCAGDPRPRAVALAFAGAAGGGEELDPSACVGRIAPRPLLFVNATRDEQVPRDAALRLHAAAREPREVVWLEPGRDLAGRALEALAPFLARPLGLAGA